jgi:GNAT superfamily N-acetyltransferase
MSSPAPQTDIAVVEDRIDSEIGAALVHAQWRELLARYGVPDADPDSLTADHLAPPTGVFLVAWRGAVALGCGGLRRYDDTTGEIKRMYVIPEARRQGISRVVLLDVEARAATIGYRRLVLETGTRQPEAMALYESAGYDAIEPYGFYRHAPQSRCYAKSLV